jgi:hypothetical protein
MLGFSQIKEGIEKIMEKGVARKTEGSAFPSIKKSNRLTRRRK